MGFSYKPLFRLLVDRNMKKMDLHNEVGLSSATLAKLSKGEPLSGESIEKLCLYFRCQVGELVEYILPDVSAIPPAPVKTAEAVKPALSPQPKGSRKRTPEQRTNQTRRHGDKS